MQNKKDQVKAVERKIATKVNQINKQVIKYKDAKTYLEQNLEIPTSLQNDNNVDLRGNNTITTLMNLKSCIHLNVHNCSNLQSLGTLREIKDFADLRGCSSLVDFKSLEICKEAYVNKNTNPQIINKLREIGTEIVEI